MALQSLDIKQRSATTTPSPQARQTMEIVKKNDFISGMYIWTGFDYIGEPTPFGSQQKAPISAWWTLPAFLKMYITCTNRNGRTKKFYTFSRTGIGKQVKQSTSGHTTTMLTKWNYS